MGHFWNKKHDKKLTAEQQIGCFVIGAAIGGPDPDKSENCTDNQKTDEFWKRMGYESYEEWEHECDIDASVH